MKFCTVRPLLYIIKSIDNVMNSSGEEKNGNIITSAIVVHAAAHGQYSQSTAVLYKLHIFNPDMNCITQLILYYIPDARLKYGTHHQQYNENESAAYPNTSRYTWLSFFFK